MTVLATQRRRGRMRAPECDRPTGAARPADQTPALFPDLGGEPALDELIAGAWEGLATHQHIGCLICGGEMDAVYGAHARPAGGRCRDCGTTLS